MSKSYTSSPSWRLHGLARELYFFSVCIINVSYKQYVVCLILYTDAEHEIVLRVFTGKDIISRDGDGASPASVALSCRLYI
jgi:hypothetical protein